MAANPHPDHITPEMWWFIEQLELLEPADTVFAGAWGSFKPGYHCDAYNLWWHQENGVYAWRNDYSIRLPDDKVLGTSLQSFGAAIDWTFKSAQQGDSRNIRKYGGRIRAAWLTRDPRFKGWREVLTQGDQDPQADGYDFVSWTERTPDLTHTWHFHFSCLRKYLRNLSVFQAMLSILRGETLAQWLARGDDDVPKAIWTTKGYWLCQGGIREPINDADDMAKVTQIYGNVCWPKADAAGFPLPQLDLPVAQGGQGWSWDEIDRLLGRIRSSGGGGGSGASADEVRVIVHDELSKLTLVTDVE